jgi:hypothetical protein
MVAVISTRCSGVVFRICKQMSASASVSIDCQILLRLQEGLSVAHHRQILTTPLELHLRLLQEQRGVFHQLAQSSTSS